MRSYLVIFLLFVLPLLQSCSSITQGSDQSVSVSTDPDGANCRLEREGQSIGFVNTTPGTIQISKSKNDIVITCVRDDYLDTIAYLASDVSGGQVGNVMIGLLSLGIGVAAVAIDSASGAAHNYPEHISISLIPESFANESERDAYFDGRAREITEKFDAARAEIQTQCQARATEHCTIRTERLDEDEEKRLAVLTKAREEAAIDGAES